jgi:hypothetical protein
MAHAHLLTIDDIGNGEYTVTHLDAPLAEKHPACIIDWKENNLPRTIVYHCARSINCKIDISFGWQRV